MDKIKKALNKLSAREKRKLKETLLKIDRGNFQGFDLKKLKGRKDIFRARKGDFRIIFHKVNHIIKILAIERRTTKTYKKR